MTHFERSTTGCSIEAIISYLDTEGASPTRQPRSNSTDFLRPPGTPQAISRRKECYEAGGIYHGDAVRCRGDCSRVIERAVEHEIDFTGAIDIDPDKIGADLGRVAGLAADLDATAADHGVTCLRTSIIRVRHGRATRYPADAVRVERVQNAATWRRPLQEKVGAGMAVGIWENKIATEVGHVGLPESIGIIADRF